MLIFYDNKKDIPDGIKVIKSNDTYFNAHTMLPNSDFVDKILSTIDKAVRVSERAFRGRSDKFADLDRQCLSTGTKTLLNILQNPDVCFNITECGLNALELLPLIDDGNIYCDRYINIPITSNNIRCNISYRGKRFNNLNDFRNYYEEIYDEEHPDEI